MEKILVTGGAGFIGSNLADFLLEKTEWKITVLDDLNSGSFETIRNLKRFDEERVEFVEGDIRDKEVVREVMEGCDYVVNLAAQVGVMPSVEDPKHDAEVNIFGLLNLLEAAKDENVKMFVHASSAAPLGEVDPPVSEDDVPRPLSPYGASKLAGEGYCSAYSGSFDLNTVALRFSNVYGPLSLHKESVIHKFIRRVLQGKGLVIYGDGEQTRDYIHVNDICRGIYLSLKKELDGFELIQLGTGEETSVNELVKILSNCCDSFGLEMPEVVNEEARKGEIRRNYTDVSKARRVLGFEPDEEIKEGVEKTFKWYLENIEKGCN